jgi:hypothetical protein
MQQGGRVHCCGMRAARLLRRGCGAAAASTSAAVSRRAPTAAAQPPARGGAAGAHHASGAPPRAPAQAASGAERLLRAPAAASARALSHAQRGVRTRAVADPAAADAAAAIDFSLIDLPTSDESDTLLRIRHTVRHRRSSGDPLTRIRNSATCVLCTHMPGFALHMAPTRRSSCSSVARHCSCPCVWPAAGVM